MAVRKLGRRCQTSTSKPNITMFSTILYIIAGVLILHSAYSAQEFSKFNAVHLIGQSLPNDIKIESIVGVLLAILAAVFSRIGSLGPIKYSEAASEMESSGNNPYMVLERRPMFVDLLAKRKEFSDWKESQES